MAADLLEIDICWADEFILISSNGMRWMETTSKLPSGPDSLNLYPNQWTETNRLTISENIVDVKVADENSGLCQLLIRTK